MNRELHYTVLVYRPIYNPDLFITPRGLGANKKIINHGLHRLTRIKTKKIIKLK